VGLNDDDQVDEHPTENSSVIVDAKLMLHLYGLVLDYSDKLMGGGFQFLIQMRKNRVDVGQVLECGLNKNDYFRCLISTASNGAII